MVGWLAELRKHYGIDFNRTWWEEEEWPIEEPNKDFMGLLGPGGLVSCNF